MARHMTDREQAARDATVWWPKDELPWWGASRRGRKAVIITLWLWNIFMAAVVIDALVSL
jgi:hypothetical protein